MVENSGAPLRAHRIRRLKGPKPFTADFAGELPRNVCIRGHRQEIETILDRWRIEDEWWTGAPIARAYFEVLLITGRKLIFWLPIDRLSAGGEFEVFPSGD